MSHKRLLCLLLAVPLAACGSGNAKVASAASRPALTQPKTVVRAPSTRPLPVAHMQALPGLEGVIGATSDDLIRQFGPARLDVWEGDARKLQFSGTACVLDVYLYPPSSGRESQASYADARRASDGQDVDRAACVAALRGK